MKKYNFKINGNINGFYQWNKNRFMKLDKERSDKFKKFKSKNGFYPDETWSLYHSIAMFVLPRLKYFHDKTIGIPPCFETLEEWKQTLDKIIFSFETCFEDDYFEVPKKYLKRYKCKDKETAWKKYCQEVNEGFELFGKYFLHLWW